MTIAKETAELLAKLGVAKEALSGGDLVVRSPVTGEQLAALKQISAADAGKAIDAAHEAFKAWRLVPGPKRGELVRLLGEELRAHKAELGRLVSIEVGKIPSEGLGEVQEMIDICDFAVGLSRQLYGLTIATERPGHRMMETWHPLGVVGVISAFNFPVAVWSWNAALALVCGDSVVWKPSEKTPLTALACEAIFARAVKRFGAMGTAGQRCTTLRRLFVHDSVYDQLVPRLKKAYTSVSVGNPLETSALVGPLVDKQAFDGMQKALAAAKAEGGSVTGGERVADAGKDTAYYVKPAIVEMPKQAGPVLEETFAPILYVMKYSDFDAVLDDHNAVAAGLSSSIFTLNVQEAERFLSVDGSDCGIANVNIGTSGAEIGGAFGGEKETGGGRESGSDAWKAYMRRQTNTINYSDSLPLAQGIKFDL